MTRPRIGIWRPSLIDANDACRRFQSALLIEARRLHRQGRLVPARLTPSYRAALQTVRDLVNQAGGRVSWVTLTAVVCAALRADGRRRNAT